eukprot:TRINITY_DN7186_c0_g1_i1.p1 TRINITY_DN7186_c0_g1~~TRINITY_DN7186_c0_g1_i1.p1  ORF type:complete len:105 (+),score=29.26 TRINITY_DN7186_c0_g1_i1:130-444(+)
MCIRDSPHPLEEQLKLTPNQVKGMSDAQILGALEGDLERVRGALGAREALKQAGCRYHVARFGTWGKYQEKHKHDHQYGYTEPVANGPDGKTNGPDSKTNETKI